MQQHSRLLASDNSNFDRYIAALSGLFVRSAIVLDPDHGRRFETFLTKIMAITKEGEQLDCSDRIGNFDNWALGNLAKIAGAGGSMDPETNPLLYAMLDDIDAHEGRGSVDFVLTVANAMEGGHLFIKHICEEEPHATPDQLLTIIETATPYTNEEQRQAAEKQCPDPARAAEFQPFGPPPGTALN